MQTKTYGALALLTALVVGIVVLTRRLGSNDAAAQSVALERAPAADTLAEPLAEVLEGVPERIPEAAPPLESEVARSGGVYSADLPAAVDEAQDQLPVDLHVVGRIVDVNGSPLSGARVRSEKPPGEVASDASGRVDLVLPMRAGMLAGYLPLAVELDGYVPAELKPSLEGLATASRRAPRVELGDLVLAVAGSISGRVVDIHGHGVADARVVATTMGPLGWSARGVGPGASLREVRSDTAGAFLLHGLGVGQVRVWAGTEGSWWAYSDGVRVEGKVETRDVLLRIEELEPEDLIELRVVDPDHRPVPKARITFFYHESGTSSSGSVSADEQGVYRRVLERRGEFDFSAQDPENQYRPAVARAVQPGTMDLVMVLGTARELSVRVSDPSGRPVPGFSVRCRTESDGRWLQGQAYHANEVGQESVVFQLPTEAFELTAEAEGYQSEVLGSLLPDEVGPAVDISLAPLPGVHGRVFLSTGKPAVGYDVGLHAAVQEEMSLAVNGFPVRSEKAADANDRSDAEGNFSLSLRESGRFYLRAGSELGADAPGEIGPLDLEASVGARGLRLDLPEPGSIEGRLLLAPERDPAGLIIGISRADGFAVTGRTDAKGRFRFGKLTPGKWYVKRCSEEIRSGWTTSSASSKDDEDGLPWSCDVWAGRTTHFDLDLTQASQVRLAGSLRMGGTPRAGWSVSLREPDGSDASIAEGRLDSQGAFQLELEAPGPYTLAFTGVDDLGFVRMTQAIQLGVGPNEWARDLPLGRVEGRVASEYVVSKAPVSLEITDPGGMQTWLLVSLEDDGSFAVDAPAGNVKLIYGDAPRKQFDVTEGSVVRVEVP